MQKIIREVDQKKGILQVTIADERWYLKSIEDKKTGIPEWIGVPSVTWIAGSYPKGVQYYKWLAGKGWDEAEEVKNIAGAKGSKVHEAIADVIQGKEVRIDTQYLNRNTDKMEELTLEECDCVLSFKRWMTDIQKEYMLESITFENTVFSEKYGYAGTIDWIVNLVHKETNVSEFWIVDFKTSAYIWPSYEIQLSAYKASLFENEELLPKECSIPNIKLAILQVGYSKNKNGYKFTEIEDQFDLFQASQLIWKKDHGSEKITKKDYPIVLSEAITLEEVILENA